MHARSRIQCFIHREFELSAVSILSLYDSRISIQNICIWFSLVWLYFQILLDCLHHFTYDKWTFHHYPFYPLSLFPSITHACACSLNALKHSQVFILTSSIDQLFWWNYSSSGDTYNRIKYNNLVLIGLFLVFVRFIVWIHCARVHWIFLNSSKIEYLLSETEYLPSNRYQDIYAAMCSTNQKQWIYRIWMYDDTKH